MHSAPDWMLMMCEHFHGVFFGDYADEKNMSIKIRVNSYRFF